jgi:ATP-binding cassette, subfamily B, bacterial MsbA
MSPAKFLGQFPALVQPGLAAGERAFELLDAPPEVIDSAGGPARPAGFRDRLRFDGVGFALPAGEPVLQDIDLEIRPGEVMALVGPSGAGKSTLADLVPRFHDPTAGRITLDGVDLRSCGCAELRGLLGIVTQETILFHDTVRANIAYGSTRRRRPRSRRPPAPPTRTTSSSRCPPGTTRCSASAGVRLSGGQRQRIAIARALLRNPPILILDEATSALDTESERLVQQAIEELMHDRTVLVIAHRLSTVRQATRSWSWRPAASCSAAPTTSCSSRGAYRRLYELQFAVEGVEPEELSAPMRRRRPSPTRSPFPVASMLVPLQTARPLLDLTAQYAGLAEELQRGGARGWSRSSASSSARPWSASRRRSPGSWACSTPSAARAAPTRSCSRCARFDVARATRW